MKDIIKYFLALLLILGSGIHMSAQDAGIRDNIGTGKKDKKNNPPPPVSCNMKRKEAEPVYGSWTGTKVDSTEEVHILLSFNDRYGRDADRVRLNIIIIERPDTPEDKAVYSVCIDASGRRLKEDRSSISLDMDEVTTICDFRFINSGTCDNTGGVIKIGEQLCDRIKNEVTKRLGSALNLRKTSYSKMSLDGMTFEKKYPDMKVRYVDIEGGKGYLAKSGLSGKYILLQWGEWNCEMYFDYEFNDYRKKAESITLLPFDTDDEGNFVLGEPVVMKCPKGDLGLKVQNIKKPYQYFFTEILSRYLMVK